MAEVAQRRVASEPARRACRRRGRWQGTEPPGRVWVSSGRRRCRLRAAAALQPVIIGSGDHIFALPAAELTRRMVVVGVVSRPRSLSADLQRVASFLRLLQDLGPPSAWRGRRRWSTIGRTPARGDISSCAPWRRSHTVGAKRASVRSLRRVAGPLRPWPGPPGWPLRSRPGRRRRGRSGSDSRAPEDRPNRPAGIAPGRNRAPRSCCRCTARRSGR
jgi:hypothetical protein